MLPAVALPEIDGGCVLTGASAPLPTTAVGVEEAELVPALLLAVTTMMIVEATSPFWSVYVEAVAPLIAEQLAAAVSQSCHW